MNHTQTVLAILDVVQKICSAKEKEIEGTAQTVSNQDIRNVLNSTRNVVAGLKIELESAIVRELRGK